LLKNFLMPLYSYEKLLIHTEIFVWQLGKAWKLSEFFQYK